MLYSHIVENWKVFFVAVQMLIILLISILKSFPHIIQWNYLRVIHYLHRALYNLNIHYLFRTKFGFLYGHVFDFDTICHCNHINRFYLNISNVNNTRLGVETYPGTGVEFTRYLGMYLYTYTKLLCIKFSKDEILSLTQSWIYLSNLASSGEIKSKAEVHDQIRVTFDLDYSSIFASHRSVRTLKSKVWEILQWLADKNGQCEL